MQEGQFFQINIGLYICWQILNWYYKQFLSKTAWVCFCCILTQVSLWFINFLSWLKNRMIGGSLSDWWMQRWANMWQGKGIKLFSLANQKAVLTKAVDTFLIPSKAFQKHSTIGSCHSSDPQGSLTGSSFLAHFNALAQITLKTHPSGTKPCYLTYT